MIRELNAYGGLQTIYLETAAITIDVLPDKSADIVASRPRPNLFFESPHHRQSLDGDYRPS